MSPKPTYEELEEKVKKLEKLEELYRSIVEDQSEFIVRWLPDGIRTFVNKSYCEYYGRSKEELVGTSFFPLIKPEDLVRVKQRLKNLTPENPISTDEHRVKLPDGSTGWNKWTDRAIFDENGRLIEYQSVGEDITERKRAEEAIQKSDKRIRDLTEMLPEAIFEADLDINLTYANREAFSLFGFTQKDFENGLNGINLLVPEERDKARNNLLKRLQGEELGGIQYKAIKKDGTVFPILLHVSPIIEQGTFKGFRGIILDLTERIRAEEALIQSEERFRLAFQTSPDAININQMDGTYIEVNEGFVELTGYSREEVVGKSSLDIKIWDIPEDRQRLIEGLKRDGRVKNLESRFLMKDGSYRYALMSANLIRLQGEPHILSITKDITDKKKMEEEKSRLEEQLHQAQKMEAIGNIAGGIAHDFNNILTIIIGFGQLIRDKSQDSLAQQNIQQILKAANRAKFLVQQILTFSRQAEHKFIPLRLQSITKEVVQLLKATTPTTVNISADIQPQCSAVNADPTQVHQILVNLCTNAVHAMDEKGVLKISLQEVDLNADALRFQPKIIPGRFAQLSVSDTGTGIKEEILKLIFDPFFTTKEVGKGTGMGLSVVHGIVEEHGGFIKVDSQVGKGSTFYVFFPVTENAEKGISERKTTLPIGTERILFIDDEETLLKLAKRMLQGLGYSVTVESSSLKALQIFKSDPDQFDLIVTDQTMPNMSGLELMAEILKVRPDIPVILCTGYSSKISEETAGKKGLSKYIVKPYDKKVLAEAIREVMNKKG